MNQIDEKLKDNKIINQVGSMKDFENWREDTAIVYNDVCKKYQDSGFTGESLELNIKAIPKCLVQLTKEMCNCNLDCVAKSFDPKILDTNCLIYDRENIFLSLQHEDCEFLEKKVINGELVEIQTGFSYMIRDKIYDNVENLCKGKPNSFEELQCKMYELKEGCRGVKECYEFIFNSKINENCTNPDFVDQIGDLERSLDNVDFIRGKRSILGKTNGLNRIDSDDLDFKRDKEILIRSKIKNNTLTSGSSIVKPSCIVPISSLIGFLFALNYYNNSESKSKKMLAIIVGASMTILILCCTAMNVSID